MKAKMTVLTLIVLITLLSLPAGYPAQGTVQVGHERHVLPSYVEPNTPGAPGVTVDPALAAAITDPAAFDADGSLNLNKAIYTRFFDRNRTAPPEAILVHIPGVVAGSNSFRIVASEIVRLSGGRFEVWAMDRRSNLLEDLGPMMAAENENTRGASLAALNAYLNNPAGPGGYIAANPFSVSSSMAEWGVDVHLRDVRTVVDQAHTVTPNVFLGGHSIGAILTQMFAAYNFGGVVGFQLVKGIIILDGTADPSGLGAPAASDEIYLNGGDTALGTVVGLRHLRMPTAPSHAPYLIDPFNPVLFQLVEIGSQLALIDPDGPSVLRQVVPSLVPVPATNAAALAINLDDEFQEQIFARFSIGFLRVPAGGSATDVATRMDDPSAANPNGLWRPRDLGATLQQWAPLKDLGSLGFPSRPEPSDFQTVARSFLVGAGNQTAAIGDTNSLEWYFPNRLVLDISKVIDLGRAPLSAQVIAEQMARGGNRITLTENSRVNVPLLAIRTAEGGLVPTNLAFLLYRQSTSIPSNRLTVRTMDNYAHVDVLTSLEKRSSQGKNVPEFIFDFIQANR